MFILSDFRQRKIGGLSTVFDDLQSGRECGCTGTGTMFRSTANFRQPMNHPIQCGLVFGEKQNDWISTCRIASCESITYIAEPYVMRLQIDCASFCHRT